MPPPTVNKAAPASAAEVRIEKLVYGGDGLARLDGQVVLAPFVLPGERVAVAAQKSKGGTLRGSVLHILEPAAERVTPRCEYFAACGGCQYQHASYEFQLQQKQAILRETLQRLGGIRWDSSVDVISAEPWFYRNRIQLHFDAERAGFRRAGSHELCEIDHCYISSPVLVEAIGQLDKAAREPQFPRFLRTLELFTNGHELQLTITETNRPVAARFFEWCSTFLPSLAPGAIEYEAAGHSFRISRGSFFQVNRFLTDALVEEALGTYTGEHALDLYAGVGLFSIPLARKFTRVDAVERGGPAFRDLEWNGHASPNVKGAKLTAEEYLKSLEDAPDLVVADPPRAGLGAETTRELLRLSPPSLVIVSCDPATLSRDLQQLVSRYAIDRIALVDLFPHTYHFETVVHLRRM